MSCIFLYFYCFCFGSFESPLVSHGRLLSLNSVEDSTYTVVREGERGERGGRGERGEGEGRGRGEGDERVEERRHTFASPSSSPVSLKACWI